MHVVLVVNSSVCNAGACVLICVIIIIISSSSSNICDAAESRDHMAAWCVLSIRVDVLLVFGRSAHCSDLMPPCAK